MGQLLPMLRAVKDNTGQVPADAGYRSEKNFEGPAGWGIDAVGARGREGKAAHRRRRWIAEPSNGGIKSVLGFRQFSLRGRHRVQVESRLVCLALHLRRMSTMMAR